jgi:hypothetical protein
MIWIQFLLTRTRFGAGSPFWPYLAAVRLLDLLLVREVASNPSRNIDLYQPVPFSLSFEYGLRRIDTD